MNRKVIIQKGTAFLTAVIILAVLGFRPPEEQTESGRDVKEVVRTEAPEELPEEEKESGNSGEENTETASVNAEAEDTETAAGNTESENTKIVAGNTESENTEIVAGNTESEETVRTEFIQEDTYPNTWTNTGNQAQDIAAIASTQVGNQEADGQYTKYAAWYYGRPLSASWNAIFVSWCAGQAEIPEDIIRKNASSGCNRKVIEKNPFRCPAYMFSDITPEIGDIAFIDDNSDSFSEKVGIITAIDYDWITVVMGDYGDQVVAVKYTTWSGEKLDENSNGTGEVIMFIARPEYE